MPDRWKEHWARIERYYERLHDARFGNMPKELLWTPEARAKLHDDMYSFFVHAYHLKDWLEADGTNVHRELASSEVLRLCADIANATKHVDLERPKIGQPRQDHTAVALILKGGEVTFGTDVVLSVDGKLFSGFSFAKRVRDEWVRVLREQALAPDVREYEEPNLKTLRPVPESAPPAENTSAPASQAGPGA
jgi:hypothetical protein